MYEKIKANYNVLLEPGFVYSSAKQTQAWRFWRGLRVRVAKCAAIFGGGAAAASAAAWQLSLRCKKAREKTWETTLIGREPWWVCCINWKLRLLNSWSLSFLQFLLYSLLRQIFISSIKCYLNIASNFFSFCQTDDPFFWGVYEAAKRGYLIAISDVNVVRDRACAA